MYGYKLAGTPLPLLILSLRLSSGYVLISLKEVMLVLLSQGSQNNTLDKAIEITKMDVVRTL